MLVFFLYLEYSLQTYTHTHTHTDLEQLPGQAEWNVNMV